MREPKSEAKRGEAGLPVLKPKLQISFYYKLQALRGIYLRPGLRAALHSLDLKVVNDQLSRFVADRHLRKVASPGLRGEVFFAMPSVIEASPFLLGYYRLLLGLSQKEFYYKGPFGRFRRLEERGELLASRAPEIPGLCLSLCRSAELLVDGVDELSLAGSTISNCSLSDRS